MRVLITGIAGFVGSHLTEFLLKKKIEVYGIERDKANTANIDHIKNRIRFYFNERKTRNLIML